jgi:hypothetical protein
VLRSAASIRSTTGTLITSSASLNALRSTTPSETPSRSSASTIKSTAPRAARWPTSRTTLPDCAFRSAPWPKTPTETILPGNVWPFVLRVQKTHSLITQLCDASKYVRPIRTIMQSSTAGDVCTIVLSRTQHIRVVFQTTPPGNAWRPVPLTLTTTQTTLQRDVSSTAPENLLPSLITRPEGVLTSALPRQISMEILPLSGASPNAPNCNRPLQTITPVYVSRCAPTTRSRPSTPKTSVSDACLAVLLGVTQTTRPRGVWLSALVLPRHTETLPLSNVFRGVLLLRISTQTPFPRSAFPSVSWATTLRIIPGNASKNVCGM